MNVFAILAATAFAVASAADCDVLALAPVAVTGANAVACKDATTYSAATATIPSGDLLKKVCSTKSCNDLLEEMKAVVPTSCTFLGKDIKTEVIDKFPAACKEALGGSTTPTTAPATTTPAPAPTTAKPTTTTAAPTTTTAAPSSTTAAPSSTPETTTAAPEATTAAPAAGSVDGAPIETPTGSEEGSEGSAASASDVTKAPAATTKVPSPSPTSGAATLTVAAGAVVATAIASLL